LDGLCKTENAIAKADIGTFYRKRQRNGYPRALCCHYRVELYTCKLIGAGACLYFNRTDTLAKDMLYLNRIEGMSEQQIEVINGGCVMSFLLVFSQGVRGAVGFKVKKFVLSDDFFSLIFCILTDNIEEVIRQVKEIEEMIKTIEICPNTLLRREAIQTPQ
jgi:hypothetical protein